MGSELYHHGILGQRWGVRRYQNKDGTLTDAGRKRYSKELDKMSLEDRKASIVRSKDSQILYQYRNEFSKEEIRFVLDRINLESTLKSVSDKSKTDALAALKKGVDWEKTINEAAKTTADLIKNSQNLKEIIEKLMK